VYSMPFCSGFELSNHRILIHRDLDDLIPSSNLIPASQGFVNGQNRTIYIRIMNN
jgi:hypothetical protein